VLQSAQTLYMRAAAAGISCGHGHERVKLLALCPRAACLRCSRDTAGRSAVACCLIAQVALMALFLHSTAPRPATCEVVDAIPKTWYAIARDVEGSAGRNPPELPREIAPVGLMEQGRTLLEARGLSAQFHPASKPNRHPWTASPITVAGLARRERTAAVAFRNSLSFAIWSGMVLTCRTTTRLRRLRFRLESHHDKASAICNTRAYHRRPPQRRV
jgi:hypothetical protein